MTEYLTAIIGLFAAIIALYLMAINYVRRDGWGRIFLLIFSTSYFVYFLARSFFYSGGFIFHWFSKSTAMRGTQCIAHLLLIPLVTVAMLELIRRRK
jgi:hypothetical protein